MNTRGAANANPVCELITKPMNVFEISVWTCIARKVVKQSFLRPCSILVGQVKEFKSEDTSSQ